MNRKINTWLMVIFTIVGTLGFATLVYILMYILDGITPYELWYSFMAEDTPKHSLPNSEEKQ
jgi:hypothetical protein